MKSVSVDPEDLDAGDVEMSEDLRAAVDREMEYLEDRDVKQVRMRCRRGSDEVYQATIHAGDEMYRLSEVSPGTVSRTVFRDPERKGDENLVGAPSQIEEESPGAEPGEEGEADEGGGSDGEEAGADDSGDGEDDGDAEEAAEDDGDAEESGEGNGKEVVVDDGEEAGADEPSGDEDQAEADDGDDAEGAGGEEAEATSEEGDEGVEGDDGDDEAVDELDEDEAGTPAEEGDRDDESS